jgi:hypothetical protein
MGGGLARLFGRGRREAATDRVARIWEEYDSVLSITSMPGRTNPSSFTTALGPARERGENSKPGRTIRPKVNGGLTTGRAEPHGYTGTRELLHGTLDPLLGACVRLEGEHICGGSTPGRQWAAESEWGRATGAC